MKRWLRNILYAQQKWLQKAQMASLRRSKKHRLLHFLHIGKTGGTAIRNAFKEEGNPYLGGGFALFFHNHGFRLSHTRQGEGVAFVVRHPIDRFVSGFYSRKRQGLPRQLIPWTTAEKKVFERYHQAHELAEALAANEPFARFAMESINHIKDKQADWFDVPLDSRKDDLLFAADLAKLSADFPRFVHLVDGGPHISLPKAKAKRHSGSKEMLQPLSQKAIQALLDWYKEDVALLQQLVDWKILSAFPERKTR